MKVVLDEGVPRQIVRLLAEYGIEAFRFPQDFAGLQNGELIARLEERGFDVLLTNDKNIASQQSLKGRRIAVVALPHNRRRSIVERLDDIVDTLRRVSPGHHLVIGWDGSRTATVLLDDGVAREALPPVDRFRP